MKTKRIIVGAGFALLAVTWYSPAVASVVCSDMLQLGDHTPICVPEVGVDETQGVADSIDVSGHIPPPTQDLQITLTEPGSGAVSDFINVDPLFVTDTSFSLDVTLVSDNGSPLNVSDGNVVIAETGAVQNLSPLIKNFYGWDVTLPAVNVVSDISDVPLPSTWAMMLAGIAVLGFAGYCKARKGAAFAA
jgi:hypothetical protein